MMREPGMPAGNGARLFLEIPFHPSEREAARGLQRSVNIPERVKGLTSKKPYANSTAVRDFSIALTLLLCVAYILRSLQKMKHQAELEQRRQRSAEMERLRRARAEKEALRSSASFFLAQEEGEQIETLPSWKLRAWAPKSRLWICGRRSGENLWPAQAKGHDEESLLLSCRIDGELPDEVFVVGFDSQAALRFFPARLEYDSDEACWEARSDAEQEALIIRGGAVIVSTLLGSVIPDDGESQARPVTITSLGFKMATIIDEEEWEEKSGLGFRVALPGEPESLSFNAKLKAGSGEVERDLQLSLEGASEEDRLRLGRFLALEYSRGRSIQKEGALGN